jgi:hypothetical protein
MRTLPGLENSMLLDTNMLKGTQALFHLFISGTIVGVKSAFYAIDTCSLECRELMPPHTLELRSEKYVHSLTVQKVREFCTVNLTGQVCTTSICLS